MVQEAERLSVFVAVGGSAMDMSRWSPVEGKSVFTGVIMSMAVFSMILLASRCVWSQVVGLDIEGRPWL